jgi:hypothetical protein
MLAELTVGLFPNLCAARPGKESYSLDCMNTILMSLPRQPVIQAYATYDCRKKGCNAPDFSGWNWNSADALDEQLAAAGLKPGVLAGYREWRKVTLDLADLRQCAVVSTISASGPRDLGSLESIGALKDWRPNKQVPWWSGVEQGLPFSEADPFILRPATHREHPALWYLEDGSGRGTAIVANAEKFGSLSVVAHGYLGTQVDSDSSFMKRNRFPSLRQNHAV